MKRVIFLFILLFFTTLYSKEYSGIVITSADNLDIAESIALKIRKDELMLRVIEVYNIYFIIAKLPKKSKKFISIMNFIKKDYPDSFEIDYNSFIIESNRLSIRNRDTLRLYIDNIPKKDIPILIALLFLILISSILFFLSNRQKKLFMKSQNILINQQLSIEKDIRGKDNLQFKSKDKI